MPEPQKVCPACKIRYSSDVLFCPQDGSPLTVRKTDISEDPYIGLKIAEQLEIRQLVGIGSMGRVYRAFQQGIERDVAVKILHRELTGNDALIARFQREARIAARLVHPNVVNILLTGQMPRNEPHTDGEAYLVMEYLDGISLRSALAAAGGALPLPRALHVILQLCDAVGEAHASGIVHRDLKPENVMLVRRGDDPDFVKVLDFGVARVDWAESSVATQAGAIFGTARYMSPEGAQGERVEAPGDVYSITTMLFQCLSGQTPFEGENPVALLVKHTQDPPPDVRSISRSSYVPEPLANVIDSNLAKAASERCRDARELGRALVQAAQDSGLSADDLVLRATLLGGAGRTLQLRSLEATKSLTVSPELAAQMAGGEAPRRAGDTEIAEPEDLSTIERISRVEPTVSDEPVPARVSRPSLASLPPALPRPPARRRSRAMIWIATSVGAVLCIAVLVVVARTTTPETAEPTPDVFVDRAEAALDAQRWDAPAGQNVKDITDSALHRWPGEPKILAVRARAANSLVEHAKELLPDEREAARESARLAAELDPENRGALALLESLSKTGAGDAGTTAVETAPVRAERTAKSPSRRRGTKKKSLREQPKEPATITEPEAPERPPPEPSEGTIGRWL